MRQTDLIFLGFTARKSGTLTGVSTFYEQTFMVNPRQTNALEYQEKLFLQLGQIKDAERNLKKFQKLYWIPCSAERKLKKAIAANLNN